MERLRLNAVDSVDAHGSPKLPVPTIVVSITSAVFLMDVPIMIALPFGVYVRAPRFFGDFPNIALDDSARTLPLPFQSEDFRSQQPIRLDGADFAARRGSFSKCSPVVPAATKLAFMMLAPPELALGAVLPCSSIRLVLADF